jgi:ectoine hydroxylase-related dioxygenase (phytanoyl-CoA dioxygenase family)
MSLGVFILLSDVGQGDSCTQYLAGTHKLFNCNLLNSDRYLSDEYDNAINHKIINLYGNKGDLIIFDVNGFHRLKNIRNSKRIALKFEITAGSQV